MRHIGTGGLATAVGLLVIGCGGPGSGPTATITAGDGGIVDNDSGAVLPPPGSVTYYQHVVPILQAHCFQCHSAAGGVQPTLDDYNLAAARGAVMAADVMSRRMPPFPPGQGCNKYQDENYLTPTDQMTIDEWVQGGAPAGDPSLAPPAYTLPPATQLGTPAATLKPPAEHTPTFPSQAGASDEYWCFPLDPGVTTATDLTALRVVPGANLSQVHHVIVFRDPGNKAAGVGGPGAECGGLPSQKAEFLSGWVPGSKPLKLPEGVGMTIQPTDRLLMQVHYYKTATPSPDQTGIELYFANQSTPEHAFVVWTGTPFFSVPAGAKDYTVTSTCTANSSWRVLGLAPHMHTKGTKFTSNINPASQKQCLMDIPKWDFQWQGGYFIQQPIELKSGDKIVTTCSWSNDTGAAVAFGESTTQEMCFGFLYVVAPTKPTFGLTDPLCLF